MGGAPEAIFGTTCNLPLYCWSNSGCTKPSQHIAIVDKTQDWIDSLTGTEKNAQSSRTILSED